MPKFIFLPSNEFQNYFAAKFIKIIYHEQQNIPYLLLYEIYIWTFKVIANNTVSKNNERHIISTN